MTLRICEHRNPSLRANFYSTTESKGRCKGRGEKKIMQVVTDRQTEGEKKSRGSLFQLSSQTVVENTVDLLAVLEVESAILPG